MHLDPTLLPDMIAMLFMMLLLFEVRRRYCIAGIQGWILGVYFLFVEILAHAVRAQDPFMKDFLHTVQLDSYVLGAVLFMSSATSVARSARRRLRYALPNTLAFLVVPTLYGMHVLSPHMLIAAALCGLVVGITTVFLVRLTLWHLMWHVLLWGPLIMLAMRGQGREMTYGLLFFLFASAAYAFYESLPHKSLGKAVMVTGFALWSVIFLMHPTMSHMRFNSLWNEAWSLQKFIIIIGMMVLLMEQQVTNKQWLAFHDELTGLPNRRLFDDRLVQAIQRTDRFGGYTALLLIDLNGFKSINDRFGHQAGDELLVKVAAHLQSVLRQTDTVARIGGDEFGVLASAITHESQARHVMAKVSRALTSSIDLDSFGAVKLDGAVGMALYPTDATDVRSLTASADMRMYEHKRAGEQALQSPVAEMITN